MLAEMAVEAYLGMDQYLLSTIFSGMNIHKSQLFWGSPGVPGFWPIPNFALFWDNLGEYLDQCSLDEDFEGYLMLFDYL